MRTLFASLAAVTLAAPISTRAQDAPPSAPPPQPAFPGVPRLPELFRPVAQQYADLVPALIDGLKDADPEVRQHCALALANLGRDALPQLLEALKDSNKEGRAAAAYALGQMGGQGREAVPALLKVLKDEDAGVRRATAQALSRIVAHDSSMHNGIFPGMRGGFAPVLGGPAFGPPVITPDRFPAPDPPPKPAPPEKKDK
jgi:hypothetical protein